MNNLYLDVEYDQLLRYDPETIIIPAGEFREIVGPASFLEILAATTDDVEASYNGTTYFPMPIGLVIKAPKTKGFRRIYIKNTNAAPNAITIAKGIGDFDDNRVVFTSATTLNVNPVPAPYGVEYSVGLPVGGAISTGTIVSGAANLNGILINSLSIACQNDPTCDYFLSTNGVALLRCFDSQVQTLSSPLAVPAGVSMTVSVTGGGVLMLRYRLL